MLQGFRAWQFVSRKFLRWLVLVPMMLTLVSSAVLATREPVFLVLLALQLCFYGLALGGWARAGHGPGAGRLLSVPFYVVLVALAGLTGCIDACRGRRFHVWEVATLSRGRSTGSV